MTWLDLLVAACCLAGAGWLVRGAVLQRAEWTEHARQIALVRAWEAARVTSPYDQDHCDPPEVTSPYAQPGAPPLPPRPGNDHVLWAVILGTVALILILAYLAALAG